MRLYPAIDLKDGKCVRLVQGDYDRMTQYHDNPVEVARRWQDMGASYLHVVDLDGAKQGESINNQVIKEIVEAVNIPVQVGGGIRTIQAIETKLKIGVDRVIIGSQAIEEPSFVKTAIEVFGEDKIVVGVDAKEGMVATHGWLKVSSVMATEFILNLKKLGVKTVVYTDIAKDGMMSGPNIEETRKLIALSGIDVIASGGISNMSDLEKVNEIEAEGAIIGKALYLGKIDLAEACERYEGGR